MDLNKKYTKEEVVNLLRSALGDSGLFDQDGNVDDYELRLWIKDNMNYNLDFEFKEMSEDNVI